MGARSLAAIFGKLDRDENLGWLAGRPAVQLGLARALGASREAVRLALTPKKSAEPKRFVAWDALPFARVLDLVEEQPFPGVPAEVLRPGAWQRLVWVAPSGGGRSLVGRFLEARGLAGYVSGQRLAELSLPPARPLYVELASPEGLELAALGPGICVALPEASTVAGDARVVYSPPLESVLDDVLAWCRARLAANTGFDERRMARWLRAGPLADGAVRSVGDVLGLAGLADALGMEALETRPLARIARDFVRRRAAERLDPDGPSTPWARRSAFDALVAIARGFAVDDTTRLLVGTSEEWSAALPLELKQGPDLDWLRAALPGADPGVLRSDVERAVTKLPPGAFRLLRTFEALGLMERSPDGLLALRPHWLVRAAEAEALSRLVEGPASGWGEALLSPRTAPALAERLFSRARAGMLRAEELAEPGAPDSPVHAAAVDGAFRAVGLAALDGADVPAELAEALWDEEQRLLFERPGALPVPRIEHAVASSDGASPNASNELGAWLLGRGAFHVAALALSEHLEAGGRPHALLRPWQAQKAPDGLAALLDDARRALEHGAAPAGLAARFSALVARLRSVVGPLGAGGAPHALERAAIVADETSLGVLAWSSVAALENDQVARSGTRHLVEERKLERAFGEAVFQAYRGAGSPAEGASVLFSPELGPLLVAGAPLDVLERLLPELVQRGDFQTLVAERLPELVEGASDDAPLGLFRAVPERSLDAALALAARASRRDALGVLWARFPAALTRHAASLVSRTDDASQRFFALLVETAPPEATEPLARALDDVDRLMKSPADTLTAVRELLHRRIRARAPGWREAYALFSELEDRFRASRKTSLPPATRSSERPES